MTIFPRFLYLILLAIAVVACKNTPNDGKDFNIEIFPKKKEYHLGDTLVVKITHPKFSEAITKTSFQFFLFFAKKRKEKKHFPSIKGRS